MIASVGAVHPQVHLDQNRGRIEVEGHPGVGSTFSVVLPARPPSHSGASPHADDCRVEPVLAAVQGWDHIYNP